jgi:hypothetical protein
LSLGNAARDRRPPDLASAEKAYRLAWKLKPTDPRPFIGLGNVYLDQERYPEAAKAYKEAIRLTTPQTSSLGAIGGLLSKKSGGGGALVSSSAAMSAEVSDLRVFAVAALLRQNKLLVAERELKSEIAADATNVRLRALLAYDSLRRKDMQQPQKPTSRRWRWTAITILIRPRWKSPPESLSRLLLAMLPSRKTSSVQSGLWVMRKIGPLRIQDDVEPVVWVSQEPKSPTGVRTWKIQDSVLELQGYPSSGSLCFGMVEGDRIELKCWLTTPNELKFGPG